MAVKLRKKALANGKLSLYLDLYNGEERKYEFLRLYLYKRPKDELEKQHNKAVTQTAENIRAKRELQAGAEQNGVAPALKEKVNFLEYMQRYIDRYTKKDVRMIRYTLNYLKVGWSRLAGHFTYESLIEKQFDDIGFQSQSVNDSPAMSAAYGRYNTRATVAFNIVKQLITGIF